MICFLDICFSLLNYEADSLTQSWKKWIKENLRS